MHVIEIFKVKYLYIRDFPGGTSGKEPACPCSRSKRCAFDLGSGRSGGGHSYPFQFSCLENPVDRGALWATVHRVAKSWTQLKRLSTHSIPVYKLTGHFFLSLSIFLSIFLLVCLFFFLILMTVCMFVCEKDKERERMIKEEMLTLSCVVQIFPTLYVLIFCLWYIYFMPRSP